MKSYIIDELYAILHELEEAKHWNDVDRAQKMLAALLDREA